MAKIPEDTVMRVMLMPLLVETFFFGMYSAVFIFSTILLYRRPPSWMRHVMLALSMVMYAVSAAQWALIISYAEVIEAGLLTKSVRIDFTLIYLPSVNYFLSDGILLWRAWVLWNRRFLLFIPPLIFLMCTFASTVASAIYFVESVHIHSGYITTTGSTTIGNLLEWLVAFFTIGTNLWATGLIFIRAWQHRRLLRSLSIKETFRTNTEKTLAFLVESGALYLCLWISYTSISIAQNDRGKAFLHSVLVQLVGMYPTMIIIVVAMQLSTADILSRPGAEAGAPFVFTPLSPRPSPQLQIAEDAENSLDGRSTIVSSDDTPQVLAPSPSDKESEYDTI